jgi:hypothetical protein
MYEIIDSYTRADMLADGGLVAAGEREARDAGIKVPVALTRAVWVGCVEWTRADADRTGAIQDETGRLWDVLTMAAGAVRASRNRRRAEFTLWRVDRRHDRAKGAPEPTPVRLAITIGPGDEGEPVITIGEPNED